jgi:Fungal specific transcription factor domain
LNIISPESVHDSPWSAWRPDVFHDLFASQVFKPLPPRSEVFSLIEDFFRTANRLFPIYHRGSFMKMVEWQYTQQTCDDAARWASINMIICLAYEFRFSNSLKPEKDREKARLYFKNAMSVFTELALRRTDLLSVQALLSMVGVSLLSPNELTSHNL